MRIGLSKPQIQNMTNLSRVTIWRWVKKFDWVLTNDDDNDAARHNDDNKKKSWFCRHCHQASWSFSPSGEQTLPESRPEPRHHQRSRFWSDGYVMLLDQALRFILVTHIISVSSFYINDDWDHRFLHFTAFFWKSGSFHGKIIAIPGNKQPPDGWSLLFSKRTQSPNFIADTKWCGYCKRIL